jgi:hypothetical protein
MKRKLIGVFLATMLLFCSASFVLGADFRNVNWGCLKSDVVKSENQKQFKGSFKYKISKKDLAYKCVLLNKNVILQYAFEDDKLISAAYLFLDSPELSQINLADPLKYYTDQYQEVKSALSQKYGNARESEIWANDTFKNAPESIGNHIVKGHLRLFSIWENENTIVTLDCLYLSKNAHAYRNRITYYEKFYYQSLQQPKLSPDLKNL